MLTKKANDLINRELNSVIDHFSSDKILISFEKQKPPLPKEKTRLNTSSTDEDDISNLSETSNENEENVEDDDIKIFDDTIFYYSDPFDPKLELVITEDDKEQLQIYCKETLKKMDKMVEEYNKFTLSKLYRYTRKHYIIYNSTRTFERIKKIITGIIKLFGIHFKGLKGIVEVYELTSNIVPIDDWIRSAIELMFITQKNSITRMKDIKKNNKLAMSNFWWYVFIIIFVLFVIIIGTLSIDYFNPDIISYTTSTIKGFFVSPEKPKRVEDFE